MGMGAYELQRANFDKLLKKYREYLDLYAAVNNGSMEGATTFDDFYIRYTYLHKYADPANVHKIF